MSKPSKTTVIVGVLTLALAILTAITTAVAQHYLAKSDIRQNASDIRQNATDIRRLNATVADMDTSINHIISQQQTATSDLAHVQADLTETRKLADVMAQRQLSMMLAQERMAEKLDNIAEKVGVSPRKGRQP